MVRLQANESSPRFSGSSIIRGMEQQFIVDPKELSAIAIHCAYCQSETIINATNAEAAPPEKCSCCRTDFGRSVQEPVRAYIETYRALLKVEHKITLRMKSN
jgi:hypothetical protein